MNTAEEMDDDRARCGIPCCLVLGAEPVCKQNAETRTRVSLQHVHNGLAGSSSLLNTDRCEDTMVDRVVEEKYLRRLDKDRRKRKEVCFCEYFNTRCKNCENCRHERSDEEVAENCEQHTEDTNGKIVDQHLEACRHMAVHGLIEFLDDETCDRSHDHGAHQHRLSVCSADACDRTDHCDCTDDAASVTADEITALCSDQDRKCVEKHIRVNGSKSFIRDPAVRDKKCCDKAPCDKCADVRHDH